MAIIVEGRGSDSAYIKMVWNNQVISDYMLKCPADTHWNLVFTKHKGKVGVSIEPPTQKTFTCKQVAGSEVLSIQFKPGVFLPLFSRQSRDQTYIELPLASNQSFWLNGSTWQFPDYDNVEFFVKRLIREEILVREPLIYESLKKGHISVSERTLRRRYILATGLTPKTVEQIERAQKAALLLESGRPILDAVYEAGYADQSHLTRSLKRFSGLTPVQMMNMKDVVTVKNSPGQSGIDTLLSNI